jgi:hypothetical protein
MNKTHPGTSRWLSRLGDTAISYRRGGDDGARNLIDSGLTACTAEDANDAAH